MIAIASLLLASGCAAEPSPTTADSVTASAAAPTALPAAATEPTAGPTVAPVAGAESGSTAEGIGMVPSNDPSAPLDTPLCGRAAREQNQAAATIASDVVSGGGACVQTACFDPLTDTFIGADGYRHVCQ